MSTLTTFLFIFVFLLVIGGWITSEVISSKTTKTNKKYAKQLALMERENNKLQVALNNENNRYTHLKDEYDQIKDAKSELRGLNNEVKRLDRQIKRFKEGVEVLRKKTSSKKYSSNSLAKEVATVLDEYAPTDAQKEERRSENTKHTFKRIKTAISGGAEAEE